MNAHAITVFRRFIALGLAIAAVVALAGCGFHLQGASPLPEGIDAMRVSYHNNYRVGDPPVVSALKQRLRRQGLLGGADAPAELHIVAIETGQNVVSISPVNGNVAEYALTTKAVFNYAVNGAQKLSGATLSVTRDYSVDDTQRLASEERRRRLLTQIQHNLANLILGRIARSSHTLAAPDGAES